MNQIYYLYIFLNYHYYDNYNYDNCNYNDENFYRLYAGFDTVIPYYYSKFFSHLFHLLLSLHYLDCNMLYIQYQLYSLFHLHLFLLSKYHQICENIQKLHVMFYLWVFLKFYHHHIY